MAANPKSADSTAAGLSGGTGFAGIVLLLPEGVIKSILLILAPALTIAVSSSWHVIVDEIDSRVADWRIRTQRKRAEKLCSTLDNDPSTSAEIKLQAIKNLEALVLLEVQISKKRVDAMVST